MLQGREGRGPGATVVPGNENDVGVGLGDTRGDGADALLAHELHVNARVVVGVLQVVDELGEVFDGVDVVVGRR